MQYYTLIASLRELTLDGTDDAGKGFDADAVYGEIRRELSRTDRRAAGLLWSLTSIYGLSRERIEQLYAMSDASKSTFLRSWSRFDRNLRNVIAAWTARGKGWPVEEALVGSDDIAVSLSKSTAADFNMKGELEYVDKLLSAMGDTENVAEKERAIDVIRWEKADELAEFDTFGMSALLAYLVKVAIIGRWAALDPVVGREMYDKLVNSIGTGQI